MKVEGVGSKRNESDRFTGSMVQGRNEFFEVGSGIAVRAGQGRRRFRYWQAVFLPRLLLSGVDILVGGQGGIPFGFQLSFIRRKSVIVSRQHGACSRHRWRRRSSWLLYLTGGGDPAGKTQEQYGK